MSMTLKVLAKRIAPGQEHLDSEYESHAMRMWNGHSDVWPNIIFVKCSRITFTKSLNIFRIVNSQLGDDYVWWFQSRSDADQFASQLMKIDGVTFWQVGKSDALTSAAQVPLLGFRHSLIDPRGTKVWDAEKRTELTRLKAHNLMVGMGNISIVLYARSPNEKKLILQKGVSRLTTYDTKKCDTAKDIIAYKPAIHRGSFNHEKQNIDYCLFVHDAEAGVFFARACQRYQSWVWHFGINH